MLRIKSILFFGLLILTFLFIQSKISYGQQAQGKTTFNIVDYGAISDGKTLNTKAIQSAIDDANKAKGGKVIFPKGNFLTGSIEIKSDVNIYLEEGAVLLGSTNPDDYKALVVDGRPVSPKSDDNSQLALVLAQNANNISLSGKGLIDGQGRALALNIDSLYHLGILKDPNHDNKNSRPSEISRPKLFRFSECSQVKIVDLTIKNAACWGLSFELCSHLIITHIALTNRAYWNNDGMDITDCQNVRITDCDVNAADDGICLKSYYPGHFNDSIYIANCTIRSSASAIKFGTASYGGFKNVTIKNIKIFDTFRSGIALESVDGGVIENIDIRNIIAVNTGNAIFIRLGNRDGKVPGVVKNIFIKDVKVQVPFGRPDINYDMRGPEVDFFHNPFPSSIVGLPGHNVENVILENIEISYPGRASKGMAYVSLSRLDQIPEKGKNYPEFSMFGELPAWGFYLRHASGITFKNIKLTLANHDFRPAFVFDNVDSLKMEQIKLPDQGKKEIILYKTKNEHLDSYAKSAVKSFMPGREN
ncbi:MAG: glycosyl hydrolase family 28 protein [Bacteroidota bacterium]|nr:glycosyl hydrolase family 28 protein [Bacteroidota bacterium]